ncbi:hypothetical protein KEM48_009990 [Puccinia striiformis f. sp. tritici PST-130]|nr:hypothetical protein KEM48_009990 [Puccinia striiformis f. sp. tritici PST-130]
MSVGDFNEEIIEFFVKAKLVMNFVEEFSQHVKQKGIISRFYPKPRATPAQIRHLAFLICDQMSMIYNLELDLMAHNINKELELHEFPHVIQHDMLGIMGNQHASFGNLREYLIQKIIASRIERSAAINNMYGQLIESLTKMNETTYDVWKKIFFEKILQLEHDLALIFDDILKDASRTILANKSNAVCKKAKLQTMFEAIDDNLLTPQINRKLKHLIQLLTAQRMEYEIPMMACLLIKGEISDFSTYQVGDLLTKSIENMHKIL